MIYVVDIDRAEDKEFTREESIREFDRIPDAAHTLLNEFYEIDSDYGDPIRDLLKYITIENQKDMLSNEFNYYIARSRESAEKKFNEIRKGT